MSSVPVIKFLFKTEWKVLTESLNMGTIYESEEFDSASDLSTYLSGHSGGLIVTSLNDKNDLIQLATLIKLVKKVAPNSITKVFVVNFSGDKEFEKACSKLGILDLVDSKIQTKALRFKIDFVMKSINAQVKKSANHSNPANSGVKSLETNKVNQEEKTLANAVVWSAPIECPDDVWILRNEADCKKVLTRWLVKVMGPSPYIAQWIDSGTPGIWKFDFKNSKNDFVSGQGTWFYRGEQKPDFVWSENAWLFAGSSFDLFYQLNKEVHSRVKLMDKTLTISRNSEFAKTKEKKIIESFDKELLFKKEQTSSHGTESIEKDVARYKNLEGKGKTDSLEQGPLSGKGKTSHLNSEPLGMDLAPGENVFNANPLTQKVDQENHSGPLVGPAGGDVHKGAELDLELKNSLEKYYKNHNKAEQYDAKDLSGQSATDEIEGYLTSPNGPRSKRKKDSPEGESGGDELTNVLPFQENSLTTDPELSGTDSQDLLHAISTPTVTSYIIKETRKIKCKLDDHFDHTIIFSAKEAGINTSDPVTLNLNFNYLEKNTSLNFSAKVTQVEEDGEGSQFITVEISPANASAFNSFMKLYHTRQKNIELFLKTAKGY